MTVREVIETGFEGVFVPPSHNGMDTSQREWRENRVREMLGHLGPSAWVTSDPMATSPSSSSNPQPSLKEQEEFSRKRFTNLPTAEQRIVLLMRALVGKPPVILLDEVWSGMSSEMIDAARKYLRERVGRDQAVVVVTHWEDEVPWVREEGLKRFRLEDGVGSVC